MIISFYELFIRTLRCMQLRTLAIQHLKLELMLNVYAFVCGPHTNSLLNSTKSFTMI